jgi:hypothetical protein
MLNKYKSLFLTVSALAFLLIGIGTPQFLENILTRSSKSQESALTGKLIIAKKGIDAPKRVDQAVKAKPVTLTYKLCDLLVDPKDNCADVTKAILVDKNYVAITERYNFLVKRYPSVEYARHQIHNHKFFTSKYSSGFFPHWNTLISFGGGTGSVTIAAAEKAFAAIKKGSSVYVLNTQGELFEVPAGLNYTNLLNSLSYMNGGKTFGPKPLPLIFSSISLKDLTPSVWNGKLQNYLKVNPKPYPISVSITGSGTNRLLKLILQIDDLNLAPLEDSGVLLQLRNKGLKTQPFRSYYLPLSNTNAYSDKARPKPPVSPPNNNTGNNNTGNNNGGNKERPRGDGQCGPPQSSVEPSEEPDVEPQPQEQWIACEDPDCPEFPCEDPGNEPDPCGSDVVDDGSDTEEIKTATVNPCEIDPCPKVKKEIAAFQAEWRGKKASMQLVDFAKAVMAACKERVPDWKSRCPTATMPASGEVTCSQLPTETEPLG